MDAADLLAQGEAQARAARLAAAGFIHHIEGLANLFQLLFGNALAVVPDEDLDAAALAVGQQLDQAALWAGLAAVVDEVIEQRFEQLPVHLHPQPRLAAVLQSQAAAVQHRLHGGGHLTDHAGKLLRGEHQVLAAHVQQLHQLAGQAAHPFGLVQNDARVLPALFLRHVLLQVQKVRKAQNTGQGRFHLVGHVGDEGLLVLGHLLQLAHVLLHGLGHPVQVLAQVRHLVRPGQLHPLGIVALGDAAGRAGQLLQTAQLHLDQNQQYHGGGQADHHAEGEGGRRLALQLGAQVGHVKHAYHAEFALLQRQRGVEGQQQPVPLGKDAGVGEGIVLIFAAVQVGSVAQAGGIVAEGFAAGIIQLEGQQVAVGLLAPKGGAHRLPGLGFVQADLAGLQPLVHHVGFDGVHHRLLLQGGPLLFPLPQLGLGVVQKEQAQPAGGQHQQRQRGQKDLLPQFHGHGSFQCSSRYPMRGRVTSLPESPSFWRSRCTWMSTVRVSPAKS